jgi:hypothetical protein
LANCAWAPLAPVPMARMAPAAMMPAVPAKMAPAVAVPAVAAAMSVAALYLDSRRRTVEGKVMGDQRCGVGGRPRKQARRGNKSGNQISLHGYPLGFCDVPRIARATFGSRFARCARLDAVLAAWWFAAMTMIARAQIRLWWRTS